MVTIKIIELANLITKEYEDAADWKDIRPTLCRLAKEIVTELEDFNARASAAENLNFMG